MRTPPHIYPGMAQRIPGIIYIIYILKRCNACLFRVASSVQESSAPLQRLRILWCHLYCASSESSFRLIVFFVRSPSTSKYFLRWRVCCALVPGTSAFDLPHQFAIIFWVSSVSQSVTIEFASFSRMKNQEGNWVQRQQQQRTCI